MELLLCINFQIQTYCSFDLLNSSSNPTLGLVAYVLDIRSTYVYTSQGWQQVQVRVYSYTESILGVFVSD